jgi:Ser/Thr protein kinase RdoA (MazF antagonist)
MVTTSPILEPFLANNLSRSCIELKPAGKEAAGQVCEVMRAGFGIGTIDSIQMIGNAGILSTNYFVKVAGQRLVLKSRPGRDEVALRLEFETALAEQLLAQGIPVPVALASTNGGHVVECSGSSWACFHHCAGTYFQGFPGETEVAAHGYANLSAALRKIAPLSGDAANEGALVTDLAEMVRATPVPPTNDAMMAALYLTHREPLLNVIDHITAARPVIESQIQVMHTDFHPLNILMEYGRLTAILDFEDIKPYPVAAANGFAAYKLIRQALVRVPAAEREREARNLVLQWLTEWSRLMPSQTLDSHTLGMGALYRVLGLLHLMFDAWLRRGDNRFNFDFQKQMGSLREIGLIFDLRWCSGEQ